MTFMKPVKAQQALRLLLANVTRYRQGRCSYASFFYRANELWTIVQKSAFEKQVENAYQKMWSTA